MSHFYQRPILCSGSTIGQVAALEPYLHAMVHEYDKTKASRIGSDQAFHNYLYYTDALSELDGIKEMMVFEQGKGIINNIGMFRSKPFREWGILNDKMEVVNWDGEASPVEHVVETPHTSLVVKKILVEVKDYLKNLTPTLEKILNTVDESDQNESSTLEEGDEETNERILKI